MRMMFRWTVPVEKGNAMVKNGSMATVIESVIAKTQPEAAYFFPHEGKRAGLLFFDMKEPADIARIAEMLFMGGDAAVEFAPVMNADDLKSGLASL